jgi:hypothetical protein
MSSYHIAKDGKQAGPIDEESIRQQIATGTLNPSDLCWCEGMADWQSIGTVFGFTPQAGAPPPLTSRTDATTSCSHQLTAFPVAAAVLLHYVTLGIFTLIWLNLMHGKMCRVRTDDPSAGKAVGFCFIPFIGLLAAIAIPSFVRARSDSRTKACVNCMRIMDAAKEQAAMQHKWMDNHPIADGSAEETSCLEYVKGGTKPTCPAGGTLQWNNLGSNPSCTSHGRIFSN